MCKSAISAASKADADIKLKEGDKLTFGKYELEVRSTPGHTNGKIYGAGDYMGMIYLRKDFFVQFYSALKFIFSKKCLNFLCISDRLSHLCVA